MKNPISKRLLAAANMVSVGANVGDIGCDHGYLSIYLMQNHIADYVCASDLREMPLNAAKRNAEKFGVAHRMDFVCADGFSGMDPDKIDTLVCCGMGGDLMQKIILASDWVRDEKYTLILQPQSGHGDFRRFLAAEGFSVLEEEPVQDDKFVYAVIKARYTGKKEQISERQAYLSDQMLRSNSEDLVPFIQRTLQGLEKSISGLEKATNPGSRLTELRQVYDEILQIKENLYDGK